MNAPEKPAKPERQKKKKPAPPTSDKATKELIEDLLRTMLIEATDSKDSEKQLAVAKHAMQWEAIKQKGEGIKKWGAGLIPGADDEKIPSGFEEEDGDDD